MNKQRERLVELIKQLDILNRQHKNSKGCYTPICENIDCYTCGCEKRADYLLANGVIVPPCKVGQTVYKVVNDKRVKKPYECKVVGIWYVEDENAIDVHLIRYVNGKFDCSFSVQFKEFGKTVFLTKEEAEAKLKEGVQG